MSLTPSPLFDQALSQHRSGDLSGAVGLYKTLLRLYPDHAHVVRHLGLAQLQLGNLGEAQVLLERAITLLPRSAHVCSDLATLRTRQARADEAETLYRRALQLDPDHTDALRNYASFLLNGHRAPHAVPLLERLVILKPDDAAGYRLLGDAHFQSDQTAAAIEQYHRALELDADDRRARLRLGEACEARGQFKRARLHYASIARRFADSPLALARLLLLRDAEVEPEWVERALGLARDPATLPEPRIRLNVALAHHFDRLGLYEEAFTHLRAGNAEASSLRPFDADGFSQAVDGLIEFFTPSFFEGLSKVKRSPSDQPIFIVGMPRSGTTLTEQILASHSRVKAGGELATMLTLVAQVEQLAVPAVPYPDGLAAIPDSAYLDLAQRYLERLRRIAPDGRRVTDKLPFNFMHLGLIAALFPRATIIQLERQPLDNLVSCYFTSFADEIRFASTLETLARYYLDYRRLMAHWKKVLPRAILTLGYESMVQDPVTETRRLLEHCHLEWQEGCLAFHRTDRDVRTPSAWQVRQPIYSTAVNRWTRYERHLQPLMTALENR